MSYAMVNLLDFRIKNEYSQNITMQENTHR